jgi:hypothetical protein
MAGKRKTDPAPKPIEEIDPDRALTDEEISRRMERGIRRFLATPPQPRHPPIRKSKEHPASKGRVHKGKTGR